MVGFMIMHRKNHSLHFILSMLVLNIHHNFFLLKVSTDGCLLIWIRIHTFIHSIRKEHFGYQMSKIENQNFNSRIRIYTKINTNSSEERQSNCAFQTTKKKKVKIESNEYATIIWIWMQPKSFNKINPLVNVVICSNNNEK